MIVKGLLFHYTTQQLADHMNERANYHDGRAVHKAAALPELRHAVETVKASAAESEGIALAHMSKSHMAYNFGGGDQIEALERDISDHRNKALVFRELAKQLIPNATYELGEGDLRRLEIIK